MSLRNFPSLNFIRSKIILYRPWGVVVFRSAYKNSLLAVLSVVLFERQTLLSDLCGISLCIKRRSIPELAKRLSGSLI